MSTVQSIFNPIDDLHVEGFSKLIRGVEAHELSPCNPSFLVPFKIKETPQYGEGHKGVFAIEDICKGTKVWQWTDKVLSIHHNDLEAYIETNFGDKISKIRVFLRQGFVLPSSSTSEAMSPPLEGDIIKSDDNKKDNKVHKDDFFHSNPTDSGRFTNHSARANVGPDGALRDIYPGEELTMDYSFHGNPEWYQQICAQYEVQTESEVAMEAAAL